jgi:hypothetical protein
MAQHLVNVPAGEERRINIVNRVLMITNISGADMCEVGIELSGNIPVERFERVKRGFRLRTPGFAAFTIKAGAAAITVDVITSVADITVDTIDGAHVSASIVNPLPLPVANNRGATLDAPVFVSGSITTTPLPPANTINEPATVAVTDAATVLVASNPNRVAVRFNNIGANPVAIGSAAITWAKRTIVLEPDDVWIEDSAGRTPWSAVCSPGLQSNVNIQEVMA